MQRYSAARTQKDLIEAMGSALNIVTTRDARSLIKHRGYRAWRVNCYGIRSIHPSDVCEPVKWAARFEASPHKCPVSKRPTFSRLFIAKEGRDTW